MQPDRLDGLPGGLSACVGAGYGGIWPFVGGFYVYVFAVTAHATDGVK